MNAAFAAGWKAKTGQAVTINQSHGGSGKQARAVIDGLQADIVTLALAYDIDAIRDNGHLIAKDWQARLPQNSSPYTSAIVLLVRKGNPEGHQGLERPGPPGCVGHHAESEDLWRCALELPGGMGLRARTVEGGRGAARVTSWPSSIGTCPCSTRAPADRRRRSCSAASATCSSHGRTRPSWRWRSSGRVISRSSPPRSRCSPSRRSRSSTRSWTAAARGRWRRRICEFLYSPEGQEIAAKHYYRPRSEAVRARYAKQFPELRLFTVDEVFGGWAKAQKTHFGDGGVFDQIYQPGT